MGMRKYVRAIAKARMKAIGMDKINKRMAGITIRNSQNRKFQRTATGRKMFAALKADGTIVHNWQRITSGDLAQEAENVQLGRSKGNKRKQKRTIRKLATN